MGVRIGGGLGMGDVETMNIILADLQASACGAAQVSGGSGGWGERQGMEFWLISRLNVRLGLVPGRVECTCCLCIDALLCRNRRLGWVLKVQEEQDSSDFELSIRWLLSWLYSG